jgi:hypothetical protein
LKTADRKFVFTVSAALVGLTGILLWRGKPATAMLLGAIAAMLMLLSVLLPAAIPPIHRGWMAGAHAMSRVTTPIILGIVYFLVLTPTGLVRRLLRQSSLRRDRSSDTYWITREVPARRPADMRRQF